MATANEKVLASVISELITHVMGSIDDEVTLNALLELQNKCADVSLQEEKKGMSWDDRFYYKGCNILDMKEDERPRVCEFVIIHRGNEVLHMYYDNTLKWILQPNGNGFSVACKRPLCGRAQLRNYLAKLGKAEEANPGAYAEKYYLPKTMLAQPTIFRDNNVIEESLTAEDEAV